MNTELHPFQREDVRRIHELGGVVLLANEVGTGKTLESLYYVWRHLPADPPGPVVVCVPAHLKINWQREAMNHLGMRVDVLHKQRVPADLPVPENRNRVYVINYDILSPPHWKKGTRPPKDSWLHWLERQKPRMVIADEGHLLSNHTVARTRAVRRLCRAAPRRMILTGTPISNKPPGLWSLLNILRPDLYPSRYEFCQEFTYARYAYGRPVFEGARSLDVLHARLTDHVMVRRRKQDVLDQLPAVTYSVVPLEIDSAEYRRAEADYIGWLEEKSPQMARSAAKAEELTRLHGLKKLAGELKVPSVIDWCRDFFQSSDAKLLLGAIHHAVTGPVVAAFGRRQTELVNGRCTDVQKNRSFDRFNLDPACRLLVGNIQSAGTGWSCRSTSDLALCEIPWVPGDVAQFVGRVHGLSRGLPGVAAHVRFLVARGTVEEDLCALLDTKQRWSELAIDGRQTDDGPDVYGKIRAAVMDRVRGRSR